MGLNTEQEIARRITYWVDGNPQPPYKIHLNLTDNCNLKCRFCPKSYDPSTTRKDMPDQKILNLIDEAAELGVSEWIISGGGEPTTRKVLYKAMEKIKEKGMRGQLITNGTLLTQEDIQSIVRMKWDKILFSIDAPDPKTHDSLRGTQSAFERATRAISMMQDEKASIGSELPEMLITMVLCKDNYTKLDEMIELTSKTGCTHILVNPVMGSHETIDRMRLPETKEVFLALKNAEKRASELGVWHNISCLREEIEEKISHGSPAIHSASNSNESQESTGVTGGIMDAPCLEPWYNILVHSDGTVGPCCEIHQEESPSIMEQSLKEIWNGEFFSDARRRMREHDFFDECYRCGAWQGQVTKSIKKEMQSMNYNQDVYRQQSALNKIADANTAITSESRDSNNAEKTLTEVRAERLSLWAEGKSQPPVTIELIPTDRCNFNCRSCWRQGTTKEELERKYSKEMSDERLFRLIDEAAHIGVREIAFVGGGEPLAREVTFELFKRIKSYGMEGDLVTNGSILNEEMILLLIEMGWNRIKVSIDGADPEVHDDLRGVKCFYRIKENLLLIKKLKQERGTEKPKVAFNTVISNKNYHDLGKIIDFANEVGCNEILILPLTIFSEEGRLLKLNERETEEFQRLILSDCLPKLKAHGISSNLDRFLDKRLIEKTNSMNEVLMEEARKVEELSKRSHGSESIRSVDGQVRLKDKIGEFMNLPCFDPWHHVTILANGNIAPCFNNFVWETKTTIKDHTLEELWYGEYFEGYRRIILTKNLPDACKTCCVWKVFENENLRKEMELIMTGGQPGSGHDSGFLGFIRRVSKAVGIARGGAR